jgi:UDP-glucose 4-epimerase
MQQSSPSGVHRAPKLDVRSYDLSGCRVLVTGGEGFIGSHLTEQLVDRGAAVTVVDRTPVTQLTNLASVQSRLDYRQADLVHADFDALLAAQKYELIFHLAGSASVPDSVADPWSDFQCNLVATMKLLESLRRLEHRPRLVLASSAAVYGDAESPAIHEETPSAPISPYGVSKLATDRYAAVYARLYQLPVASLRPFAVYGPRLRKQVVYDFIRKLSLSDATLQAHGDGTQVRDFCYVTDVVEAAICVARQGPLRGEVYNVAASENCSIHELLERLSELLGKQVRVEWSGHVRPGEPQRWLPDAERLRALGWASQVSLQEGLRRTVDWYRTEFVPDGKA